MIKQQIKPNPECSQCHGWGTVYDTVDYGSTTAQLPSFCACVEEQADEDTDEIELILEPIKEGVEEDFDEQDADLANDDLYCASGEIS